MPDQDDLLRPAQTGTTCRWIIDAAQSVASITWVLDIPTTSPLIRFAGQVRPAARPSATAHPAARQAIRPLYRPRSPDRCTRPACRRPCRLPHCTRPPPLPPLIRAPFCTEKLDSWAVWVRECPSPWPV